MLYILGYLLTAGSIGLCLSTPIGSPFFLYGLLAGLAAAIVSLAARIIYLLEDSIGLTAELLANEKAKAMEGKTIWELYPDMK